MQIKGVHGFLEGISLKVNIIAWLGFEIPYFEAASSTLAITPPHFYDTEIKARKQKSNYSMTQGWWTRSNWSPFALRNIIKKQACMLRNKACSWILWTLS